MNDASVIESVLRRSYDNSNEYHQAVAAEIALAIGGQASEGGQTYGQPGQPGHYRIDRIGDGWRWVWVEFTDAPPTPPDAIGPVCDRESEAFRLAAEDWDVNGPGDKRLLGTLKAQATRLEKAGR